MNVLYPEGITDGSQWLSAATPLEHEQQKSLVDSEGVTEKPCLADGMSWQSRRLTPRNFDRVKPRNLCESYFRSELALRWTTQQQIIHRLRARPHQVI